MLQGLRHKARAAVLAGLLLQGGCRESENGGGNLFDPATLQEAAACEQRSFEGSRFTVCTYDAARDTLRLAWRGKDGNALRSLTALETALGAEGRQVRFATNAGMYDEEGAPIGLYVAAGERLKQLNRRSGPGNFHLLPNGVFAVDQRGQVSVTATPDFDAAGKKWATQSGPMLVIGGRLHPKFDADGPSRLIRNGVGVRNPRTAYFVISEEGVSFGRFARFFRDALGCADALYLDGTVSSLWDPAAGRQDPYAGLGPILVVLKTA